MSGFLEIWAPDINLHSSKVVAGGGGVDEATLCLRNIAIHHRHHHQAAAVTMTLQVRRYTELVYRVLYKKYTLISMNKY